MATNHTENYQLNLWEPTDAFLREEFNENFQKIDDAVKHSQTVTGYFQQTPTEELKVTLGFRPSALILTTPDPCVGVTATGYGILLGRNRNYTTTMVYDTNTFYATFWDDGFSFSANSYYFNDRANQYVYYIAFR